MVPPHLASAVFRLLMSVPRSRIEAEAAQGCTGYEATRQVVLDLLRTERRERTAREYAELLHAQFIQACTAQGHPGIDDAVAFHLTGIAARQAALCATLAASERGELGRINRRMDETRDASGDEDFDERDESLLPADYLEMSERACEIMRRVEVMMVPDLLRRYGFDDHAELFEADEAAFDARVQEGYYTLFPHPG